MTTDLDRRSFLKHAAVAASVAAGGPLSCGDPRPPPSDGWRAGEVAHLLPTANADRVRIKASFHRAQAEAPILRIGDWRVTGLRTDTNGRFYTFDSRDTGRGLAPSTTYTLQLQRPGGEALCEEWPLRTFPAPDASPERLRLLAFTCAGGPDNLYNFGFFDAFLPIPHRQRLFARALSFEPDAMVANGDHVYWDMKSSTGIAFGRSPRAWWVAGSFDRDAPVLDTPNEVVLHKAFGPQIAGLYGVMFRSVPSYFLQDDHDYGENDEASDALRTFPPDPFMLDLARTTQRLYYPELLPDESLPRAFVNREGVAESFGSLRYGRLFEGLLYDCRRHLTNTLDPALASTRSDFVPPAIEAWLLARSRMSPARHLAHMPSTPILWTAGKWGEWYPDGKDEQGALRLDAGKPYWAPGWGQQHDRLLEATVSRKDRTPLFASGDLHATAAGRIHATHGASLGRNPVVSLLTGAIGTGALGWPSKFRGQLPVPSGTLDAETLLSPLEENGFSLLDFEPDELRVSLFRWLPSDGEAAIDTLEPFEVLTFPRPGA